MDESHRFEHFRPQVQPAVASKLLEFQLLGLDSVSEQDFWDFLIKKKWKKIKEDMKLYVMIQEILSVKASDYLNFATIEAYKTSEFSMDDEDELKELLK
ncbi:post-transcriptional regulator [Neobacillus sp. SuZ13]|uniref:post-transcriptional regulator n=1 Tax=Neobacillus sp. SuZ13 TaxID=3047875 RepID=UPI0024BF57A0|nr:post-transcriptional regulator [Neobacillus sp. SuZ13]WHY65837.1 post-transcriptional regulator [Neobacillus sp. SuZ13]